MKHTVDYFIKKFKAIPNNKWITNQFVSEDGCCAFGHCGIRNDSSPSNNPEAQNLIRLFKRLRIDVANINDGYENKYQQKHPRTRILAALRDIKKLQTKSKKEKKC